MKRYKALSRVMFAGYLLAIFAGVLFGLMLTRYNAALSIVFMALSVLDLAALIVAKHLFVKSYRSFFIISVAALAYLNIVVIGLFIIECALTAQGLPASYAWMIASISLVLLALVDIFYPLSINKIYHKKLIEEGVLEPDPEEEV